MNQFNLVAEVSQNFRSRKRSTMAALAGLGEKA